MYIELFAILTLIYYFYVIYIEYETNLDNLIFKHIEYKYKYKLKTLNEINQEKFKSVSQKN